MDFKLRIGERSHVVAVPSPEADGTLRLVVDDRPLAVVPRAGPPGALAATVDGRPVELHVARCAEGTWVWCAGRARLVQDAGQEARRPSRRAGAGDGAVTPAFPSVVVAVLVKEGEVVRKNQPLVVVSAMKMESRLVAPWAGTVRAIRVEVGASVKPGDELVAVEREAGGSGNG